MEFRNSANQTPTGKNRQHNMPGPCLEPEKQHNIQRMADFSGTSCLRGSKFSIFKLKKEAVGPNISGMGPSENCNNATTNEGKGSIDVVVQPIKPRSLDRFFSETSNPATMDGCLRNRLGSSRLRRPLGGRVVEPSASRAAYESLRNSSGPLCTENGVSPNRDICESVLRQPHHGTGFKKERLFPFFVSDVRCAISSESLLREKAFSRPTKDSRQVECPSRRPVQERLSTGRMGSSSSRLEEDNICVPEAGDRLDGNTIQQPTASIHLPVRSPNSTRSGCMGIGLEQMEVDLSVSPPITGSPSIRKSSKFQRQHGPRSEEPPNASPLVQSGSSLHPVSTLPPPSTIGERHVEGGWKTRILTLDRSAFLRSHLLPLYGEEVTFRILGGKRTSTRNQQEVAWKALQAWFSSYEEVKLSKKVVLEFLTHLRVEKNLKTSTILNYKASLATPLKLVFNIDLNSWEFKELGRSLFIERPPNQPRIPSWDLVKVLDMLRTEEYSSPRISKFSLLKKCIFLTALACGNRISELAAFYRTGLRVNSRSRKIIFPVAPGFLFKNQRLGRCPPAAEVLSLEAGPSELCPVKCIRQYLKISKDTRGPLFRNSKTERPLNRASISKLICSLIEEADPGKLPQAHDVRRVSTSIAWTRGIPLEEIARRAFWKSSSTFINRYLSGRANITGVALNSC